MSYYGFPEYVTVAERRAMAERALKKLKKSNPDIEPVIIEGRVPAKSWWGKAWTKNLEVYADYDNRIARGKSYVCGNAVLDLKISKGSVIAKVIGSKAKPYETQILIDTLSNAKWREIIELCNRRIDTLEQLIRGRFPKELEALFTDRKYCLFPSPKEIHFSCSCPDYASMCKHVAAVLYGIGARLDHNPLLFFDLRDIDAKDLIRKSMDQKIESMLRNAGKKSKREIASKDVQSIFGL